MSFGPCLAGTPPPSSSEREELVDLITRKEVALEAIRELEFDHSVGKIEDEDFGRFNRILRNRAMRLIERTDAEYGVSDGLAPQAVHLNELLELEISKPAQSGGSASE